MKKGLIIFALVLTLLVFSLFLVSGQSCGIADDSQLILRLSGTTNAHAENWSEANYPIEICFNNIFGYVYDSLGADAHVCNGNNLVLRLSNETNAHGEVPDVPASYGFDVCYDGLICQSTSAGECNAIFGSEWKEVVSLSAQTNAHLSSDGSYANKICCFAGGLTNPIWEDIAGNQIGQDVNPPIGSYVGRTVRLVSDTSFTDGTQGIIFEVWESDIGNDEEIRTINVGGGPLVGAVINGRAVAEWPITSADMSEADSLGEYNDDVAEFYFKVIFQPDPNINGQSNELWVSNQQGPDNSPQAVISGIANRETYFNGTQIEFNHSSFDTEGPIASFSWTILSNGAEEFTSNEESFLHTFTEPGMRIITLEVEDDTGQKDKQQIAILIVASPYILTYINEPFFGKVIESPGKPPRVDFDASDSYVIDVSIDTDGDNCPDSVTCLAGDCPQATNNTPQNCLLNNIQIVNTPQDFADLYFNWTFGRDNTVIGNLEGFGDVSGWKSYSTVSKTLNDKWIELLATYDQGGGNEISEKTDKVAFTLGKCISDGTQFIETDGNGNIISVHDTMSSVEWCSVNGIIGDGDDCCPIGFACSNNPEGCVISDDNINECTDYDNEADCLSDQFGAGVANNHVYEPLVNQCEANGATANIACRWSTENNPAGECVVELNCQLGGCIGNQCGSTSSCTAYSCSYNYPESECIGGYITISYNSIGSNSGNCPNAPSQSELASLCARQPISIPCGRLEFELSFFDLTQFIIASIIILLVYLILYFRREQ